MASSSSSSLSPASVQGGVWERLVSQCNQLTMSPENVRRALNVVSKAGMVLAVAMSVFGYKTEGKKGAVLLFGGIISGWASYNGYQISKNSGSILHGLDHNTFMAEELVEIVRSFNAANNE